ncbi:MAG TPA: BTAD domain-containing putative transcriptional regulator [Ktedonobacteraceae bacterium]|nr:BTAD domain-containing putative transcriptional regulator [Ktedonobacteraceae bacterium]
MPRIYDENPFLTEKLHIHPREHEHQAVYRGYFFGQFRLFYKKEPVGELMRRRNKARMLLKWFLLNPGKLGSADEFIDLFWPDISADTALCNFHVTIHYLRHMLEPALKSRQESTYIHRKPNNFYWFQMDEHWWTDVNDVQKLFERAREYDSRGDDKKAAFYYRKIASYCSAGFLPEDEAEEWLIPYRRRYDLIYSQVLMRLIQLYTQRDELEEVLEYAYQWLLIDPYSEIAIRAIVDAHLQQGNISIAQRRLDAFWRSLRDLGLHPGKEFHALRARILAANN